MMGIVEVGELVKGMDNVNVFFKIFIKYYGFYGIWLILGFLYFIIVYFKFELECLNNFFLYVFFLVSF